MTSVEQLLMDLAGQKLRLWVEDGRLCLRAPKGVMTPELRQTIEERKAEILTFLKQSGADRGASLPILPVDRSGELPLSFSQERFWFLGQMYPDSPVSNLPNGFWLDGPLDADVLLTSVNDIVARHESLRTTFLLRDERPVLAIAPEVKLQMVVEDLYQMPEAARQEEARRLATEEAAAPFDLTEGPLLRLRLIRLSTSRHLFVWTVHHSVSDGWSSMVFLRELQENYKARLAGQPTQRPPLSIDFPDYAAWERGADNERALAPQIEYWKGRLGTPLPPLLALPADRARPAVISYRGGSIPLRLSATLRNALTALAQARGATIFMLLLAAFQVLLHRLSGQRDIAVGTPIAGRNRQEVENLIGCFINMLVIRCDADPGMGFDEFLARVKQHCVDAYSNQDVPFERLVQEIQPQRSTAYAPIFQAMLILHVQDTRKVNAFGDVQITPQDLHSGTSKFDLTLELRETGDGLDGWLEYNSDLFDAATVARFGQCFACLLDAIVAVPDAAIGRLALLDEPERQQLLVDWNATARSYDTTRTLPALISAQIDSTPEAVAVRFGDAVLRYGELGARIDHLAQALHRQGIGRETRVGVCLERSHNMLIAVLAVLRAGGAYVPLDPQFPTERLAFMMQDAGLTLLLTETTLRASIPDFAGAVLSLDEVAETAGASTDLPLPSADDLAYVIYTSGSTGLPKGVEITHGALLNFLLSMRDQPGLAPSDRLLAVTTLSFDIAALELYLPLLVGAEVVIVDRATAADGLRLAQELAQSQATVMQATPSTWRMLLEAGWPGDSRLTLLSGGEPLPRELASRLLTHGAALWNLYGPTETTIWSTVERVMAGSGPVGVGRPIANTEIYILDEQQQPVPIGVTGELLIGGHGLARGYLGREALTAERFIPHPFDTTPGARLYRTGDTARYHADGTIEVLGRMDHQVKLRGYRIELGEIEAVLAEHPSVAEVVAVVPPAVDGSAGTQLVAYVVGRDGGPAIDDLRALARRRLPDYMVPAHIVPLAAMPRTANEKIDRKALPAVETATLRGDRAYQAPRTATERLLADIWSEVLGLEQISINDNFFDLGGHSLMAVRVVGWVNRTCARQLEIVALFEYPTIARLALHIDAQDDTGGARLTVPPRPDSEPVPLSFAQRRLWFLDQLEGYNRASVIVQLSRYTGPLDIERLRDVLRTLSERHEILRTVFPSQDGEAQQRVRAADSALSLEILSFDGVGNPRTTLLRAARKIADSPVDLASGPLVRFAICRIDDQTAYLISVWHHIVIDGWSLRRFETELVALYTGRTAGRPDDLPELPISFGDFAYAQQLWMQGDLMQRQLAYWKSQLDGIPDRLRLPYDRPPPAKQSYDGDVHVMHLAVERVDALERLAREKAVTPFMLLLAAFQVLLHRLSGQGDIVVGSPMAGRVVPETEPLLGSFVNMLALRGKPSGDLTFSEFLMQMKSMMIDAFAHADLPFEKLVEELRPSRNLSHSPIFQVMLVLQNFPAVPEKMGDVIVAREYINPGASMYDLSLYLEKVGDGALQAAFEYNSDLFDAATVARFGQCFACLLDAIVAVPDAAIGRLALLDEPERQQLLVDWNATARSYDTTRTLPALISAQIDSTPEAVAVRFGDAVLRYGELGARIDHLAQALHRQGIGRETRVGVCLERSHNMLIAVLAVLRAGGAYVPLDPQFPTERLAFMMQDAGLTLLLTETTLRASIPDFAGAVLSLDEVAGTAGASTDLPLPSADDLAYVIYTSGSTGLPKGVEITHGALLNFLLSMRDQPGLAPSDRLLAVTTLSFDIAALELYLPLLVGAEVVIVDRATAADGLRLAQELAQSQATVMQATPSTWRMLLEAEWPGDSRLTLLSGGEPLPRELASRLLTHGAALWNLYGPTETTIWSTVERVMAGSGPVGVGRPIANTEIYILDEQQQPVPIGVTGELLIGGHGLARGYLGREALTAERFIPHPFDTTPGARLYRTGDTARYHADGTIEVLGRMDHQVKLRGYRIELGEIEAVLAEHPAVAEVVAVVPPAVDGSAGTQLVAYVVGRDGGPAIDDLRALARRRLPDYMVPAHIVPLAAMPRTANEKIDRKALPAVETAALRGDRAYQAPRTATERLLADIWSEVLGLEQISINDNFFDLGGHSLMAVRLFSRIVTETGQRLPMASLFTAPSIALLAAEIENHRPDAAGHSLVAINPQGDRPPLYCVHGEGGEVLFYRPLSEHLGPDQPVYGLQASGLDGVNPPDISVEAMAERYLVEVRAQQPHGPYHIAGHCFGALVAFEMALRLQKAGEEVALLALLDGAGPPINHTLRDSLGSFATAFTRDPLGLARYLLTVEVPHRRRQAVERWQQRRRSTEDTAEEKASEDPIQKALDAVASNISTAYRDYNPGVYDGKMTCFVNSERYLLKLNHWDGFARDGTEMIAFEGDARTSFNEPSIGYMARELRRHMDAILLQG